MKQRPPARRNRVGWLGWIGYLGFTPAFAGGAALSMLLFHDNLIAGMVGAVLGAAGWLLLLGMIDDRLHPKPVRSTGGTPPTRPPKRSLRARWTAQGEARRLANIRRVERLQAQRSAAAETRWRPPPPTLTWQERQQIAKEERLRDEAERAERVKAAQLKAATVAAERRRIQAEREAAADVAAKAEGRWVSDWQTMERASAAAMRALGFVDARLTPRGADSGLDVVSAEAVAQVKYQKDRVGRPALQRLVGAELKRKRLFYAFGDEPFASTAVEYADEHRIALFALDQRGDPTPC